ncbi:SDR family NAD(P)-dependent oxidoreductase [Amphritea japonica]|uniref:Capsular polysaccharide export protein n=1 Tax=Amphritea japonica ATCC BAA-1530 TaxID=1278309 RepID=A0A7R6PIL2_9GAMM|nr:SDR family NAD(P)-dependent oxidoreductase [Amphritea japonica]BBB25115.1 capsular polysaccharide export protein [Amphritea japonica ATCC BAA-1530]
MLKHFFNRRLRDSYTPAVILITGATGAIGAALAKCYAGPGVILLLQGRQERVLDQVAQQCVEMGAEVRPYCIDLLDAPSVIAWLDQLNEDYCVDLFIANAGMNISTGVDNAGECEDEMLQLLDLNIKATLLMSSYLSKEMRKRGSGKIALISSLAGFYGLPMMPSYCASKAAVKAYGEALRGWLSGSGVGVTVIMPGNIQSAMCDGMLGPKPFLMTPEYAARVMQRGIARNAARVSFPFPLNLGTWCLMLLPASVSQKILRLLSYSRPKG